MLHELAAGEPGALPKQRMPEVTDEFGEARGRSRPPRGARYDLVHAHYWLSGIASLPVALELGHPARAELPHARRDEERGARRGGRDPIIRLRSETFLANQADALIASSSAEATALIDDVGAPADRTWIMPPGVDLDLFTPRSELEHARVRRALGARAGPTDRRRSAGRVQPLKGHELAVRALAELHALRGWAPLLVDRGRGRRRAASRSSAMLRALAGELGVAADVRFVGALDRDSMADLLAAADVTIVPSFSETFGLVALESAAAAPPRSATARADSRSRSRRASRDCCSARVTRATGRPRSRS